MDGAELHEYIRLARERAGFDTPVLAARLVGDRLELHLLGGELLTFSLSELQPGRASDGEAPALTAKVRAPKPKPEPLPVRKGRSPSATRKGGQPSAPDEER